MTNAMMMARRAAFHPYTSASTSPTTYTSGKRKAPPSVMSGPKAMSLTAPMLEMSSSATKTATRVG